MNHLFDVYVRYLPFPTTTEAVVIPNDDATFDIYLNSKICEDKQKAALAHELEHIKRDHLYNEDPVVKNEREAG